MTYQGDARHTAGSGDHDEWIRRRAYEIYLARGDRHGADFDDWLAAERELAERGEPSALSEPAMLTARVDADAGVLGTSAPGDVTSDGAATGSRNATPTGKGAAPRKAAATTTPAMPAAQSAPTKSAIARPPAATRAATAPKATAATSAAKGATKGATKGAAKGASKPAPEASTPAASKPSAPRRKTTPRDQPGTGNGGTA